ncbi:small subunit ribosomal protein S27, partial [Paragonimus westermani]
SMKALIPVSLLKYTMLHALKSLHKLSTSVFLTPSRCYLPQAYFCDQQWNARLAHDAFKNVSARDLGLTILQAIGSNEAVSSLDYDIFANKLHELDVISLDFIQNIIEKYSHTQAAVHIVDSTAHAIVRGYLDFKQYDKLLELLQQRSRTGVFLDFVSANLLLDRLVDLEQWTNALHVIWEMCLQEYFDPFSPDPVSSLTFGFALLVEYRFVKYVRNANYDNFFDVQRPRLKLGFTLLHLSNLITHRLDSLDHAPGVGQSLRGAADKLKQPLKLFGLAYSDQLAHFFTELQRLSSVDELKANGLSKAVLEKLLQAVESCLTRSDDAPINRGEPVLPTISEVSSVVTCLKQRLQELGTDFPDDFFTTCTNLVKQGIFQNHDCLNREITSVEQLYSEFECHRDRIWRQRLETTREARILRDTKESLRALLDEEERLTYFKRYNEVIRSAWLAPRTRQERIWSRMKEWRRDIVRKQEKEQGAREARADE